MSKRRAGFTLIEAIAVVVIIGILATLGIYIATQAQRQARDAKRKSDVYAISQAFEARFLDKTCPNPLDIGKYPGSTTAGVGNWVEVRTIAALDDCYVFSQYLPTIPEDPQYPDYSYYFNLSTVEMNNGVSLPAIAKHFRLAASLERGFAVDSPQQLECLRNSSVWVELYGGKIYDCEANVITRNGPLLLIAGIKLADRVDEEICDNGVDDNGDGQIDEGCESPPPPPGEICGNKKDDDGDGVVDEDCDLVDGGNGGNNLPPPDNDRRDYNYYLGR